MPNPSMPEENPDGSSDIILSLETNNQDSDNLLPTLTLYTGERIHSNPKPPVNLQLSLGGSYSGNPNAAPDTNQSGFAQNLALFPVADNSCMMKRSYMEQNQIPQNPEEIVLIDNVQGITADMHESKEKEKDAIDLVWAIQSASQNPALQRALSIIKSEVRQQRAATRTMAGHEYQCGTSNNPHAIQGDGSQQPELVFQALEPGNSVNPDDYLAISPSNFDLNVDFGLGLLCEEPAADETLVTSSMISPTPMDISGVNANAELQAPENLSVPIIFPTANDKGKALMIDEPSINATMFAPLTYYGTSVDGQLMMNNFSGSISGATAFATASPISRSTAYMPQGATFFSNSQAAMQMTNSVPPFMAASSSKENDIPQGVTFFSNSQASMQMPNLVPPFMAASSSKENDIPQGATFFSNSQAALIQMPNPVPPFMAASSSKENDIPGLMHCDPYMTQATNANISSPAVSAFASNPWANTSIQVAAPLYGSTTTASTNTNLPPEQPAKEHPLMKRSGYVPDSQIDMIKNMPTVATDGGIPNGKKIEGFLYKYNKYQDVIIVCFCHGAFLSPREFVMHAGGSDVENPMRLITIVPED